MPQYPKTMQRGPLKGQTFNDSTEYLAALKAHRDANPEAFNGAPKQRGKRAPKQGPVTVEMAEGLIAFINVVVSVVPALQYDALEEYEQKALALAIVETAQTNAFFANIVLKIVGVGSQSRMIITVGGIVATRLARREIIPVPVGLAASAMVFNLAQQNPAPIFETVTDVPREVAPVSEEA